jgi:hypothetical protein
MGMLQFLMVKKMDRRMMRAVYQAQKINGVAPRVIAADRLFKEA